MGIQANVAISSFLYDQLCCFHCVLMNAKRFCVCLKPHTDPELPELPRLNLGDVLRYIVREHYDDLEKLWDLLRKRTRGFSCWGLKHRRGRLQKMWGMSRQSTCACVCVCVCARARASFKGQVQG